MRISMIGCGYVGLVTGACLAEAGHQVVCTDKDQPRIALLQSGRLPIYEPHLDAVVATNCRENRLSFTADAAEAVRAGDVIFICVGTPPRENGEADLSAIDDVARLIACEARAPKLIVEKSTVPAQTGRQLKRMLGIYSRNGAGTLQVASNPEFLREGSAVEDFLHPDRVVLGVEDEAAERQLREIYHPILAGRFRCPVHAPACSRTKVPQVVVTTISSAELIKHASNSFLALKISYANLVADLCERVSADVDQVIRAVGLDSRIGAQFLRPGLGFGGFCFPKDIQAFMRLAEHAGVDPGMLREAEGVNHRRVDAFMEKIRRALWVVKDKQVALLGLAFKPNTDDIRFAPSLEIIRRLSAEGAHVRACDPQAIQNAAAFLPEVHYSRDPYEVARDADALLIVTEWESFRDLDWERVRASMARPLVIDGRNLLNPAAMRALGFEYDSFGRPAEVPPAGSLPASAPAVPKQDHEPCHRRFQIPAHPAPSTLSA